MKAFILTMVVVYAQQWEFANTPDIFIGSFASPHPLTLCCDDIFAFGITHQHIFWGGILVIDCYYYHQFIEHI